MHNEVLKKGLKLNSPRCKQTAAHSENTQSEKRPGKFLFLLKRQKNGHINNLLTWSITMKVKIKCTADLSPLKEVKVIYELTFKYFPIVLSIVERHLIQKKGPT